MTTLRRSELICTPFSAAAWLMRCSSEVGNAAAVVNDFPIGEIITENRALGKDDVPLVVSWPQLRDSLYEPVRAPVLRQLLCGDAPR